jgi:DNA-binding FadR family transcriptional regulator
MGPTPGIQRTPLADQVADLLLDRIRSEEWALGEKLPGETRLAAQLGVGRSTIRESIRQLVGRGVLSSRQGAGVFVTALDAPDGLDVVLRRADIAAVVETRLAVETEASALAAQRRSPAQLRAIRRALAVRADRTTDVEAHVDADIVFHRSVVLAAGNPLLEELFDSLTPRIRRAMIDMLRLQRAFGSEEDQRCHADLVETIASRDPEVARAVSRAHLLSLLHGLT